MLHVLVQWFGTVRYSPRCLVHGAGLPAKSATRLGAAWPTVGRAKRQPPSGGGAHDDRDCQGQHEDHPQAHGG